MSARAGEDVELRALIKDFFDRTFYPVQSRVDGLPCCDLGQMFATRLAPGLL